jgi:hypothetical protein
VTKAPFYTQLWFVGVMTLVAAAGIIALGVVLG